MTAQQIMDERAAMYDAMIDGMVDDAWMTEQARQTALAQVYAAVATLIESPGSHDAALAALDMAVTALGDERR